jgi:hypothetical protein
MNEYWLPRSPQKNSKAVLTLRARMQTLAQIDQQDFRARCSRNRIRPTRHIKSHDHPAQFVNQRQRVEIRHTLEAWQPAQADKGRTITATAKTNVPTPAKEAGQADITRNEMPTRVIGVATVSTPIRGFLGFPTSPDAGDL